MSLCLKNHRSELLAPGDYCITSPPHVILSCPICGLIMDCTHEIVSANPLTLTPSVVGPHNADQHENCGHHFFIEKGEVKPV